MKKISFGYLALGIISLLLGGYCFYEAAEVDALDSSWEEKKRERLEARVAELELAAKV